MKIKHGVSSPSPPPPSPPTKYEGVFFIKKNFAWGTDFFGQIYGGMGECFTWELMIRSCKGEEKFH